MFVYLLTLRTKEDHNINNIALNIGSDGFCPIAAREPKR
jgi:hypothetical protein